MKRLAFSIKPIDETWEKLAKNLHVGTQARARALQVLTLWARAKPADTQARKHASYVSQTEREYMSSSTASSTASYKAKQLIVMRRDLKMRKGKIAAQSAHAAVEAVLMALAKERKLTQIKLDESERFVYLEEEDLSSTDVTPTALDAWFSAGVAKICVYVDSEEELLELAHKGRERGLLVALIRDAGITEFHGTPTYTCLAFEPLYPEDIDPLTRDLPLY